MDHGHGSFFAFAKPNGRYHGQPLEVEYRTALNGDVTRALPTPAPAPGGGANAAAGGAAGDGNDADGAAEGDDDGEGEGDGDEPPPAIPFPSPSLRLTCMTSAVVVVFPLDPADSAPYGCDTHLSTNRFSDGRVVVVDYSIAGTIREPTEDMGEKAAAEHTARLSTSNNFFVLRLSTAISVLKAQF